MIPCPEVLDPRIENPRIQDPMIPGSQDPRMGRGGGHNVVNRVNSVI